MGSKITPRPPCKPKIAAKKEKPKAAETKAPATKAPAPNTKDTFETKTGVGFTYQKIESIWKEGNITGTDDWQKAN